MMVHAAALGGLWAMRQIHPRRVGDGGVGIPTIYIRGGAGETGKRSASVVEERGEAGHRAAPAVAAVSKTPETAPPAAGQDGGDDRGTGTGTGTESTRAEGGAGVTDPVRERLKAFMSYPFGLRQRGIRGKTVIRFHITQGGGVQEVQILASSGSPLLDEHNVRTVRRASPYPVADERWVTIGLEYHLDEKGADH